MASLTGARLGWAFAELGFCCFAIVVARDGPQVVNPYPRKLIGYSSLVRAIQRVLMPTSCEGARIIRQVRME